MKIQVDGKEVLNLNETQKKVIKNDILEEIFQEDMERRVAYILQHKYEQCFKRLKEQWEPKLASRMELVPTNPDKFAELVFSQPEYKSRSKREQEAKEQERKARTGQ